jgi:protein-S-isoprenylcysteine O-methyltransferase Ste14
MNPDQKNHFITLWLLLKSLLFTALVPGFVVGWVPWVYLLHRAPLPVDWTLRHYAALAPLLAGGGLYFACLWQFAANGRGTPAPFDPPRKLVRRGPYRWVRNPMYLSLLLLVLGEAVFFRHVALFLYLVFLASGFQLFVEMFEEPSLRRQFGAMYSDYCGSVRRWWPRRPRPTLQTVAPFPPARHETGRRQ